MCKPIIKMFLILFLWLPPYNLWHEAYYLFVQFALFFFYLCIYDIYYWKSKIILIYLSVEGNRMFCFVFLAYKAMSIIHRILISWLEYLFFCIFFYNFFFYNNTDNISVLSTIQEWWICYRYYLLVYCRVIKTIRFIGNYSTINKS